MTESPTDRPNPDPDALVLLCGSIVGPSGLGVDPDDEPQRFVLYAALYRLSRDGKAGNAALRTLIADAARSGIERGRRSAKLKRAERTFQEAAAQVIAELPPHVRANLERTLRGQRARDPLTNASAPLVGFVPSGTDGTRGERGG